MDNFFFNGVTYTHRTTKCGKAKCKCRQGKEHGPYWYASTGYGLRYVGKKLPHNLKVIRDRLVSEKDYLDELREQIRESETKLYRQFSQLREQENAISALVSGSAFDHAVIKSLGLSRFILE